MVAETLEPKSNEQEEEWEEIGLGNLILLGDADKEVKEAVGKLTGIRKGRFDNTLYDLIVDEEVKRNDGEVAAKEGEDVTIAGTSAIEGKITEEDVGATLKFFFEGWSKSEAGRRYKNIKVFRKKVAQKE